MTTWCMDATHSMNVDTCTGAVEDFSVTLALTRQDGVHIGDSLLVLAKGHCLEQLLGISPDRLQV